MARIYHRPPRPQEGATARPGCVHSHVDPPRERGWAGFARVRSTWFSTRPLFCQTRNEGLLNHSPIRPDTGLPSPSSLSLPSSAHARKRRGKVVNARHGGRRRTALFLDFIQGEYILLPFAPKDSAPTSRVHLVGGQVASPISSLPLLSLPMVFSREKERHSRQGSWTSKIFLIKEEKTRRRLFTATADPDKIREL